MKRKGFKVQGSRFSFMGGRASRRAVGGDANRRRLGGSLALPMFASILLLAVGTVRADVYDTLIQRLGSTNEEARATAAGKLAELGGPRAMKQFRLMIEAGSPERRQMAVVGLLQVSDAAEDVERVHGRLQDESELVRWSAVVALGQSGHREALEWLKPMAETDKSEDVREAATEAMKKLEMSVRWRGKLPEGMKEARELKKPVVVYFYVRGSEYCRQFEESVWGSTNVVKAAQEFVCVRVDGSQETGEARRLDVRGAPTVLVLDGQGEELGRVAGLVEAEKVVDVLTEAAHGKVTVREARRLATRDAADVEANWTAARSYLEEGREDLAEPLLRNVVAHDEANRYGHTDSAMFALGLALGHRGQHASAAVCVTRLLEKWPEFKHKDKALYCLGLSRLASGQKEKGREALENLIREFPESSAVGSARQALEKLGAK